MLKQRDLYDTALDVLRDRGLSDDEIKATVAASEQMCLTPSRAFAMAGATSDRGPTLIPAALTISTAIALAGNHHAADPEVKRPIDETLGELIRDVRRILEAGGVELPPEPIAADAVNNIVARVLQNVCDLPDRTSPEGQPDMLMVTSDELDLIVRRALGQDV